MISIKLVEQIGAEVYIPPFQILTTLPQEQTTQLSRDLRKVVSSWQQSENIIYTKLLGSNPPSPSNILQPNNVNNLADSKPPGSNEASSDANVNFKIKTHTSVSVNNDLSGGDKQQSNSDDHRPANRSDQNLQPKSRESKDRSSGHDTTTSFLSNKSFPTKSPVVKSSNGKSSYSRSFSRSKSFKSPNQPYPSQQQKQNKHHSFNQTMLSRNQTANAQSNVIKLGKQPENQNYDVVQNDAQQFNETNSYVHNENSDLLLSDDQPSLTSSLTSNHDQTSDKSSSPTSNKINAINSELLENSQLPPSMMWTRLRLAKTNAQNTMTIRPADIPLFSSPLPIGSALANILPTICDHVEIHNPSLILSLLDGERHRAASLVSQAAFIPMLSYTREYQVNPTSTYVSCIFFFFGREISVIPI